MPTIISEETLRARKHHQCFHCYRSIALGEEHRRMFLKHDGEAYTLRFHFDCDQLWIAYDRDVGAEDWGEGYAPIADDWTESGEFQNLCDHYRGRFPHAITRLELNEQIGEIQYSEMCRARGIEPQDYTPLYG